MSSSKSPEGRRTYSPQFKWKLAQEYKVGSLSMSALARQHDVNANQLFRWVREAEIGQALWVRRVTNNVPTTSLDSGSFLPVKVQAKDATPAMQSGAITVSFRSGHQLVLQQATPDMLRHLVAALS